MDPELLDQGEQAKPVHVQERFGPQGVPCHRQGSTEQGGSHDVEGVMEVRNNDDVPGAAGQRTCEETALVTDEMADYHFKDLLWKPGSRGRVCRGNLWGGTTRTDSSDSG